MTDDTPTPGAKGNRASGLYHADLPVVQPAAQPTPLDLDELQRLWEQTTDGVWFVGPKEFMETGDTVVAYMCGQDVLCNGVNAASLHSDSIDQKFIAAAHNAWPQILDEIRRRDEECEELTSELSDLQNRYADLTQQVERLTEANRWLGIAEEERLKVFAKTDEEIQQYKNKFERLTRERARMLKQLRIAKLNGFFINDAEITAALGEAGGEGQPTICDHFEQRPGTHEHPMECGNCHFHRDAHAEHFNRSYNEWLAKYHPEEVAPPQPAYSPQSEWKFRIACQNKGTKRWTWLETRYGSGDFWENADLEHAARMELGLSRENTHWNYRVIPADASGEFTLPQSDSTATPKAP